MDGDDAGVQGCSFESAIFRCIPLIHFNELTVCQAHRRAELPTTFYCFLGGLIVHLSKFTMGHTRRCGELEDDFPLPFPGITHMHGYTSFSRLDWTATIQMCIICVGGFRLPLPRSARFNELTMLQGHNCAGLKPLRFHCFLPGFCI